MIFLVYQDRNAAAKYLIIGLSHFELGLMNRDQNLTSRWAFIDWSEKPEPICPA